MNTPASNRGEFATADQAHEILDTVNMLTAHAELFTPFKGVPERHVKLGELGITAYPEGILSIDDPNVMELAGVYWDDADSGPRTVYTVELSTADGLLLSKHVYPPVPPLGLRIEYDPDTGRSLVAPDMPDSFYEAAARAMPARKMQRELGLHRATRDEAADLLGRLASAGRQPE